MDLTNIENRRKYIKSLSLNYISDLEDVGMEFSDFTLTRIDDNRIVIYLGQDGSEVFGSGITFYPSENSIVYKSEAQLNLSSASSLTPDNKGNFFKITTAAMILNNWKAFVEISEKYCHKIAELKQILVERTNTLKS